MHREINEDKNEKELKFTPFHISYYTIGKLIIYIKFNYSNFITKF